MKTKQIINLSIAGFMAAQSAFSTPSEITLNFRYQNADSQQIEKGEQVLKFDSTQDKVSDAAIEKTLLVSQMGKTLKSALKDFHAACSAQDERVYASATTAKSKSGSPSLIQPYAPNPIFLPTPMPPYRPVPRGPSKECLQKRELVESSFLAKIAEFNEVIAQNRTVMNGDKLPQTLDLFRKLALNMKNYKDYNDYYTPGYPLPYGGIYKSFSQGGTLGVTSGGAQDFGFVRKLINDGNVPVADNIDQKGFMGEFSLSLNSEECTQLICINPAYKVDSAKKKLYVQVGMNSNLDENAFERKAINLALVIDISGSMSATDDTEKTRLAWAKEAALKTVSELREGDFLSIVVFVRIRMKMNTDSHEREHLPKQQITGIIFLS